MTKKYQPYVKKEWVGALADPIPWPQKGSEDDDDRFKYWANQARKKLPDLFTAFGMDIFNPDPLDEGLLLMYLAAQAFPGFRIGRGKGKPKQWNESEEFTLLNDVQSIIHEKKISPMAASKWLHANNPKYKKLAAITIETRFRKTMKKTPPLALALFRDAVENKK